MGVVQRTNEENALKYECEILYDVMISRGQNRRTKTGWCNRDSATHGERKCKSVCATLRKVVCEGVQGKC